MQECTAHASGRGHVASDLIYLYPMPNPTATVDRLVTHSVRDCQVVDKEIMTSRAGDCLRLASVLSHTVRSRPHPAAEAAATDACSVDSC
jgi:hypothetical protein